MRDLLTYQIAERALTFGSNREFATTPQFVREEDNIPARPFLELTTGPQNDASEIATYEYIFKNN